MNWPCSVYTVFFGQALVQRLGDTEVDHLGLRLIVAIRDQHIARFQIPVDDPLLVRMLDSLANLDKEPQAILDRQLLPIAMLRDRRPRHVLHHKVRPPLLGLPAVVNLGDTGMIHHRQGLPLGLKPRNDLRRVHPQLDDLERHPAPHRLVLLCEVHHPHPALAEHLKNFIRTD